jgi:hypothetical protein
LKDKIMVHVITKIERPAKEVIDRFRGIGTATVSGGGALQCGVQQVGQGF